MPSPQNLDLLNSIMFCEAPSTLQNRFEYNVDTTVLYAGYAIKGAAASDEVWTIQKFTYTSQMVTLKQTAVRVAWDNRASATYE